MLELNNLINQMNLTDHYRTFRPNTTEHIFSEAYENSVR